jgi:hypothetical protein
MKQHPLRPFDRLRAGERRRPPDGRGAQDARLPATGVRRYPKVSAESLLDHFAVLKGIWSYKPEAPVQE